MSEQRSRMRGFTLVELLVVIAIIALLLTLVTPTLFRGRDEANKVACLQQLKEIGNSFQLYRSNHEDRLPPYSGIRFLLGPWKAKIIENTDRYAKIYRCPGDKVDTPIDPETKELLISDFDNVNSSMISYSGRDPKAFPLKFTEGSTELLASDDDENEPNHPLGVNVLYLDGSVDSITYEVLGIDKPEDFKVGADSPVEGYRNFRVLTNE